MLRLDGLVGLERVANVYNQLEVVSQQGGAVLILKLFQRHAHAPFQQRKHVCNYCLKQIPNYCYNCFAINHVNSTFTFS